MSQEPRRPPHQDAVAETARWTAAARAQESDRADRLFDDPLARDLAGAAGFEMLARFDQRGDGNPYLPIRTRWYDDVLTTAVKKHRQVVMLAAGLDTRAYRLPWAPQTVLFEVDQPRLLADKQVMLDGVQARLGCDRRAVAVDLGGDWITPLEQAGYQRTDPAVFTAEGLLFYLTESVARTVLTTAAELAAPGSRLAVDLVNDGFFRFPSTRDYLEGLAAASIPWRFGTDDPDRLTPRTAPHVIPELVSQTDIAHMLDTSRQRVIQLRQKGPLPDPVMKLSGGHEGYSRPRSLCLRRVSGSVCRSVKTVRFLT